MRYVARLLTHFLIVLWCGPGRGCVWLCHDRIVFMNPGHLTLCLVSYRHLTCHFSTTTLILFQTACCGAETRVKQTSFVPRTGKVVLKKAFNISWTIFHTTSDFMQSIYRLPFQRPQTTPGGRCVISPFQNHHTTSQNSKLYFCQNFGGRSHFLVLIYLFSCLLCPYIIV